MQDTDNCIEKVRVSKRSHVSRFLPFAVKMFHQGLLCRRRRLRSDPSHYVTSLTCALCWRRRRSDLDKPARILPGRLSKAKSVRIFPLFIAVQSFFCFVFFSSGLRGGKVGVSGQKRNHGERREHGPPHWSQGTQHAPETPHARRRWTGGEICNRFGKKKVVCICLLFVPSMLRCPGTGQLCV